MIRVAGIQIAPVFLDANKTWKKLNQYIRDAHSNGAKLVTWSESLIPGYPLWVWITNISASESPVQKKLYAKYWNESIDPSSSDIIEEMKHLAKELDITLMGGITERDGGTLYCSLITISSDGELLGRHRKVKPTHSERLVWGDGDKTGLKTHTVEGVQVGGLNCYENWLPLARASLHRLGEMVHIAAWPGSHFLCKDITRFIALEGRSYVLSVSGILRPTDFSHLSEDILPFKEQFESRNRPWYNGGSLAVSPTGEILSGPLIGEEGIIYMDVNPDLVIQERQTLDISGHYSRFDLFNDLDD